MPAASEILWVEQLELARSRSGEWPNVYLLGIPAGRITFADRQKRAFNPIAALLASGRVKSTSAVAIIGAGAAGITAAACGEQSKRARIAIADPTGVTTTCISAFNQARPSRVRLRG